MRPKYDRIQINMLPDFVESEIICPEKPRNAKHAEVVAVGENVQEVKVGDKIILKRFKPVKVGQQELTFTKEDNVLAKYE